MEEHVLHNPVWHRSTTLQERVRVLRKRSFGCTDEARSDLARAARRLTRWRSRASLERDDDFSHRLALDGLNEEQLLRLLGEPAEILAARQGPPPEWVSRLLRSLSQPAAADTDQEQLTRRFSPTSAAFLSLLQPLISEGRSRLEEKLRRLVARHPGAPLGLASAAALCLPYLYARLHELQVRTLVLEMNVARLEGLLTGGSAEERFQSFIERMRQPAQLRSLLAEYPVLARRLVACVDTWVSTSFEMLERLTGDFQEIRLALSPNREPGELTGCEPGAGDAHRGGRTVVLLTFSSGLRLVYKPRSLAVAVHFQELLTWLDDRGATPALRTTRILDRGSYGWVEFIERSPCRSIEEVRRFYERQGGYLALLYVLEATDAHLENIIAAGEHPVLIDHESLFHSHFPVEGADRAGRQADLALAESVLRVGLLPTRSWADEDSEGIDFSALGAKAGQLSPGAAPIVEGVGTDEMRIIRKRVAVDGSSNLPMLEGVEVGVLPYADAFKGGFSRMYRLLLEHRDELLDANGPLSRFATDEVRIIVRPTYLYHLMLRESAHPDNLRDALDLDGFFDRLWKTLEHMPYSRPLIPYEREDLWRDDIPFFTSRPRSRDIWSSNGQRLPDFFPASGLELSRQRIETLSEEDLSQQLWFIEASFTAISVTMGGGLLPSRPLKEAAVPASRERLLARAETLGDRLAELAYRRAGSASWIGLMPVAERYWLPTPLGIDLYSGLSGVALFLAWLGELTGKGHYTEVAWETLASIRQRLEEDKSLPGTFGAFGDCGVLHALAHLGALWNEPRLWDEAEALLARLPALIDKDKKHDVFGGAAGCILLLLGLDRCRPSSRARELAVRCGEQLLASAQTMEQGLGWPTPLGPSPLTGLLHGASGIAWALFELATATGEERFRTTARRALEYERAHFSPEAGNWRDLRAEPAPGGFMVSLCHGAPGVGLARLFMLPNLDAEQAHEELSAAVATTLARGFGGTHSLCHGDLGNLEFLMLAEKVLGQSALGHERQRLAAAILTSIEEAGVLCGVPLGVETPGFMTGLAGVGYALLRLAEPERVPSVLALELPGYIRRIVSRPERKD
ncbi:Lanthionine biosynthesis protein LanM [Cystobacter fuscus DSM 2262]|uniref:Lanthionine biosynthesis protein LanM n=1 Tax=Cystobacter fuscus (strain ATCC 25194 / DSM 2262 / NBRC 100088 / M29) TaxID=1242864 RepID=S9NW96_CYSF2|nr:type 2 lanthipeptide synthetase LanM family protein [Cystobacter fuscus]EPX56490.1 Lanthionine biosynthesis protein LanM [Cystobacter fuscus DSM 2262]